MWHGRWGTRTRRRELQDGITAANAAAQKAHQAVLDLAQEIHTVAQAARQSVAAAEAAAAAAQAAQVAAVSATKTVSTVKGGRRRLKGPWEMVLLISFCASTLGLAAWFARLVPPAYTDPSVNEQFDSGAVEVALAEPDTQGAMGSDVGVVIAADYIYDGEYRNVQYTISFPENLRGRKFLIILQGSATLSKPGASTGEQVREDGEIVNDLTISPTLESCSGPFGDLIEEPEGEPVSYPPCQVITGILPKQSFFPPACGQSPDQASSYISVWVGGTGQAGVELDWAHRALAMPNFDPLGSSGQQSSPPLIDTLGNVSGDGEYQPVRATGCKQLWVMSEWRVGSLFVEATSTVGDIHNWASPTGVQPINVILKRMDAEATANLYIILTGFLGGVSVGFMPIAYAAGRDAFKYWTQSTVRDGGTTAMTKDFTGRTQRTQTSRDEVS